MSAFQLGPALLHPAVDGVVVALGRAARRPLPAPAQAVSQDVPHPCRVVAHAGHALDHLSHALQGPHIVGIPVGFGAFSQVGLDLVKLFTRHLRQSTGTSSSAQPISARPSPYSAPVGDDLMTHAEPPRDLGWCEQLRACMRRSSIAAKSRRGRTRRDISRVALCFTGTELMAQSRTTRPISGTVRPAVYYAILFRS